MLIGLYAKQLSISLNFSFIFILFIEGDKLGKNMRTIYIDPRWGTSGGIGTFYKKINEINKYERLSISGSPVSPYDSIRSSVYVNRLSNALVFYPGYIPPLFSKNPYVFTIHDLNHLDRPENSSFFKKTFYNTVIKKGCLDSKFIFTVSEFSRQRILEWSGVDDNKVVNVGNGVSPRFNPVGDKLTLGFDFILCVSNRKGHKNEIRTLNAFALAKIPKEIKLVFTGEPDEVMLANINELKLNGRVYFTGYLDDAQLPNLYRASLALVFVSLYEGFGLPVIEAQATGVPVITSNTTALSEIAGQGALLVDPLDVEEIADSISLLLIKPSLCESLVRTGFENIKHFTWEKTAEKVHKYLEYAASC